MARPAAWVLLGAGVAGASWLAGAAGIPSPPLFAALLVGLGVALAWPDRIDMDRRWFTAAQAVTGAVLGGFLHGSSLSTVGGSWLPVLVVSLGTLGLSLATGLAVARLGRVDRATAALGLIAGGASGIVSMAGDLGADDRLVAFMQYARVLVIVLITPLLAAAAFPAAGTGAAHVAHHAYLGDARAWLLTLAAATVGGLLGRRLRLPAAALLGPMLLAGAVTMGVPSEAWTVPPLLRDAAFALIGLQVGLRFTRETVRQVGGLVVPVLGAIAALIAGSFVLAVLLHATAPVSLLDAYLATTPGGLYAVLAIAVGAGSNTAFVIAVQSLRLLVMVLLAPLAVRWVVRRRRG